MVIGPGLLSRALDPMPVRLGADTDAPDIHMLILDDALTPPITLWTLCYSAGRIEQQPYAMLRLAEPTAPRLARVARQRPHLESLRTQLLDQMAADEAGRAGDQAMPQLPAAPGSAPRTTPKAPP